jgi:hypothetical protein
MKKNKVQKALKQPILWKDICLVLVIKGIIFFSLWFIFFSNPNSKHINTNQAYVDHLLSQPTPTTLTRNP